MADNVKDLAKAAGLYVTTWRPGDGMTRYKFFTHPASYDEGDGVGRAVGRKEAVAFLRGYLASHGRNPPGKVIPFRTAPEEWSVEDLLSNGEVLDQEIGDMNEIGWYGMVSGLLLPEALDAIRPAELTDADQYDWPLNAIIHIDSQGFKDVTSWKNNREMMREWRLIEKAYDDYYGEEEG